MAASTQSDGESISDINIVPLVDIILVVLIIFMVTVPQAVRTQMEVDLPSSSSGVQSDEKPLQVTITKDDLIYINDQEVGTAQAEELIRTEVKNQPELQAVITADKTTDHGLVVEMMDLLKTNGVKALSVAADPGGSK